MIMWGLEAAFMMITKKAISEKIQKARMVIIWVCRMCLNPMPNASYGSDLLSLSSCSYSRTFCVFAAALSIVVIVKSDISLFSSALDYSIPCSARYFSSKDNSLSVCSLYSMCDWTCIFTYGTFFKHLSLTKKAVIPGNTLRNGIWESRTCF